MSDIPIGRFAALAGLALATACAGKSNQPDAYGTFEADDVTVSAETTGQLMEFLAAEGNRLDSGATAAVIDSIQLSLELTQARSRTSALAAQRTAAGARVASSTNQLALAERSLERTQRLAAGNAATAAQLDHDQRTVEQLRAELQAARASITDVTAQEMALTARISQLTDRLAHSVVVNPVSGTVLTTYVRTGEFVQPGKPLYSIAPLDTLILRAYVAGNQLGSFKVGDRVNVHVDGPSGLATLPGTIAWMSDQAEFTPTPVQTRDERTSLVYAIKVRVANRDGLLKIGMPGDLSFASEVPRGTP